MTVRPAARPIRSTAWVPVALVALVLLPAVAGALRLVELSGGARILPANPTLTAGPRPCAGSRRRHTGAHPGLGVPLIGRGELAPAVLHAAGSGIDLAVAEYAIRRWAA